MLRKLTIAFAAIMFAVILSDGLFNKVFTYTSAPFPNRTGSIGDNGLTCGQSGCHSQTATPQTGWITSDIPAEGYTPGSTYTLTASAMEAGKLKFGFEVTAENSAGAQAGTFVVTDFTRTRILDIPKKYIGHSNAKADAVGGSQSWSFKWTAPAKGTGTVTFYGAFNASNNNSSSGGDKIYTSTLAANEATPDGVEDPAEYISALSSFPNPAIDDFNLKFDMLKPAQVKASLYDLSGKEVLNLLDQQIDSGEHIRKFDASQLSPGMYLIKINVAGNIITDRLIIQ